uniref:MoeA N-terminal and linker domain-containing protein n=1 Tax=Caenorhabditis japonica TaxID=281687 RepID=A0A8R1DMH5_CAEJA
MSAAEPRQPISLTCALHRLDQIASLYPPESKTVDVAQLEPGRILARDIEAEEDIPAVRTAIAEGFATMAEYTGTKRQIVGLSTALSPYYAVIQPGECVRITTGGVVPDGADTVVPYDDGISEEEEMSGVETIEFHYRLEKGENIRESGSEAKCGDILLKEGIKMDSMAIGLLHALGISKVEIYRKPRVCVVSIVDCHDNSRMKSEAFTSSRRLLALFNAQGFKGIDAGCAKGRKVADKLRTAADFACVIVATGSMEMFRQATKNLGLQMDIDGIGSEPGNFAISHGNIDNRPVLVCMLPGDANFSWIGANTLVSPILRAMEGRLARNVLRFKAKLLEPTNICSQVQFVCARTEMADGCFLTTPIGSNSILGANSILEIPENVKFSAGDVVTVFLIESQNIA